MYYYYLLATTNNKYHLIFIFYIEMGYQFMICNII